MLAARDTPTRERKSLDGLWRFVLDPEDEGRNQNWFDGLPAHAREMPVPASYNDIASELHDHVGEAWYETAIRIPRHWQDRRTVLRFDSATHRAEAFVNGRPVVTHEGGYTPFEADVTDVVRPGGIDRITVTRRQPADLAVDPAGERRADARWAAPVLLPRLLQLCGPAPAGLGLRDAQTPHQ